MRKFFYFIVASLVLAGCANNEILDKVPESKVLTIGVNISQDNHATRSTFNEEETGAWSVVWEAGDKIKFCYEYTINEIMHRDLVDGEIISVNETDPSKATAAVTIPEAITTNMVPYKIYAATGCGYIGTPDKPIMTANSSGIVVNTEPTDLLVQRNLDKNPRNFLDRNIMIAKTTTDVAYDATNVGLKFKQAGAVFDVRISVPSTSGNNFKGRTIYLESATDWVYEAGTAQYDMINDTWSGTPSKIMKLYESKTNLDFAPGQTGQLITWFVSTGAPATDLTFWLNKNASGQHQHQVFSGTIEFENGKHYILARNWDGKDLVKPAP